VEILSKSANERHSMGKEARARIQEYFNLDKMVADYYQLYDEVLAN